MVSPASSSSVGIVSSSQQHRHKEGRDSHRRQQQRASPIKQRRRSSSIGSVVSAPASPSDHHDIGGRDGASSKASVGQRRGSANVNVGERSDQREKSSSSSRHHQQSRRSHKQVDAPTPAPTSGKLNGPEKKDKMNNSSSSVLLLNPQNMARTRSSSRSRSSRSVSATLLSSKSPPSSGGFPDVVGVSRSSRSLAPSAPSSTTALAVSSSTTTRSARSSSRPRRLTSSTDNKNLNPSEERMRRRERSSSRDEGRGRLARKESDESGGFEISKRESGGIDAEQTAPVRRRRSASLRMTSTFSRNEAAALRETAASKAKEEPVKADNKSSDSLDSMKTDSTYPSTSHTHNSSFGQHMLSSAMPSTSKDEGALVPYAPPSREDPVPQGGERGDGLPLPPSPTKQRSGRLDDSWRDGRGEGGGAASRGRSSREHHHHRPTRSFHDTVSVDLDGSGREGGGQRPSRSFHAVDDVVDDDDDHHHPLDRSSRSNAPSRRQHSDEPLDSSTRSFNNPSASIKRHELRGHPSRSLFPHLDHNKSSHRSSSGHVLDASARTSRSLHGSSSKSLDRRARSSSRALDDDVGDHHSRHARLSHVDERSGRSQHHSRGRGGVSPVRRNRSQSPPSVARDDRRRRSSSRAASRPSRSRPRADDDESTRSYQHDHSTSTALVPIVTDGHHHPYSSSSRPNSRSRSIARSTRAESPSSRSGSRPRLPRSRSRSRRRTWGGGDGNVSHSHRDLLSHPTNGKQKLKNEINLVIDDTTGHGSFDMPVLNSAGGKNSSNQLHFSVQIDETSQNYIIQTSMGLLSKIRDIHPQTNILRTLSYWNGLQKCRYGGTDSHHGSNGGQLAIANKSSGGAPNKNEVIMTLVGTYHNKEWEYDERFQRELERFVEDALRFHACLNGHGDPSDGGGTAGSAEGSSGSRKKKFGGSGSSAGGTASSKGHSANGSEDWKGKTVLSKVLQKISLKD
eukprot:g5756.t1 g5756   contig20:97032-100080(+)